MFLFVINFYQKQIANTFAQLASTPNGSRSPFIEGHHLYSDLDIAEPLPGRLPGQHGGYLRHGLRAYSGEQSEGNRFIGDPEL